MAKWWMIHNGPRRDVTVETFNGLLSFDSRNWLIGKYLYVKRSHEDHEIQEVGALLRSLGWLKPGGTVLNVGANIGMTCIALVKLGVFQRAIAVEPGPDNYRLLVKNVEQNGLAGQIECLPFAFSSTVAPLTFELSKHNSGDHRVRQTNQPGFYKEETRPTISVPGETLDHYFAGKPDAVDVIWADIQGHEGHLLRGGRDFLRRGIPVVTEFWPYGLGRSGVTPEEFVGILAQSFSHFWVIGRPEFDRAPITDVRKVFALYEGPRSFGMLVLAPKNSR